MPAGHVIDERAMGGGRRRELEMSVMPLSRRQHPPRNETGGSAFDVAFNTGDLSGEGEARIGLEPQSAVEIRRRILPFLEFGFLAGEQIGDESLVLLVRQRTVDVVLAGAAGSELVVTRLKPGNRHVDRIAMDDRCDGIKKKRDRSRR